MFQAVSTNADKLEWTEINLEQTSFAFHTGCAVDDSKTKVMQMLFIEINSELTCRLSHGQQRKLLRLTRTPQSALFFGELMDQISGFIYYSMFSI